MSRTPRLLGATLCCLAAFTACSSTGADRRDPVTATTHPTTTNPPASTATTARLLPTAAGPVGLAVDADGRVWVANADAGSVSRVDLASGAVGPTVPVGSAPLRLAAVAGSVWVSVFRDGTLVRIDARTGKVADTVPVGQGPEGVVAAYGALWVVVENSAELVRVDPATARVTARHPAGTAPRLVAAAFGALWVSDFRTGGVVRVDPRSGATRPSGVLCAGPQGMAATHDLLWVACTTDEQVVAIDPATLEVVRRAAVGGHPDAVAVVRGDRVLVLGQDGPRLTLLDGAGRTLSARTLGTTAPLHDQANVDLAVVGPTVLASTYLAGGVHVTDLP
jgi:YVTN family beta-propeller protein